MVCHRRQIENSSYKSLWRDIGAGNPASLYDRATSALDPQVRQRQHPIPGHDDLRTVGEYQLSLLLLTESNEHIGVEGDESSRADEEHAVYIIFTFS